MENLNDIKIWSVLRFHPDIEGSPFQRDYPIYRIWDPTDEAKSQINRNIAMKEAFKLTDLIKDKAKDLVNFARYLGEDVHSSSNHSIVYGMILKAAASDPYTFIRKWNNKTRGYAERFFSGVALGLINNEPDNGLVYRNITLGFSEEDAIQKLSEDPNLMKNLVMDISERDIVITKIDAELSRPAKKEIE
jgi:hypothetical protein